MLSLEEKQNYLKDLNSKIEELISYPTVFKTEISRSSENDESFCDKRSNYWEKIW